MRKNGEPVAEYGYDPEGFRVARRARGETTHYVFEGTEPVFEKNITTGEQRSYVFALGRYLARVDGAIGDPEAIEGFIETISVTVEKRDPYTAGHQKRVAHLAQAIAKEMGFSGEEVESGAYGRNCP